MGVYIKGMTLDEFSECSDYCKTLIGTGQAEEVPPHGRLIDADKMKENIRKQTEFLRLLGEDFAEIGETLEKGFLQEINNALTVIPASEEKI